MVRTATALVAKLDCPSSGWPLSHCCMESSHKQLMCGEECSGLLSALYL